MQFIPSPPVRRNQKDASSSLSTNVLFLFMGLLAVVTMSFVLRSTVGEWYTWVRLQQQGAQVQGTPIELTDRRGHRRIVEYEYKVRGKDEIVRAYRRQEQVTVEFFAQLERVYRPGSREVTITVYYLPEYPAVARLTSQDSVISAVVKFLFGICAILLFSVMPLGGIGGVVEYLQRERLDKVQNRMLFIGIGIFLAILVLFIVFPPSEVAMMEGIVSIHP